MNILAPFLHLLLLHSLFTRVYRLPSAAGCRIMSMILVKLLLSSNKLFLPFYFLSVVPL